MQNYDTQNTLPATQPKESKLSLDNASHENIPQLEQKLMSMGELTPEKNQTTTNDILYNHIIHHMHCNTKENYVTNAMGILHKKVIDFNSTFSSVVIPNTH